MKLSILEDVLLVHLDASSHFFTPFSVIPFLAKMEAAQERVQREVEKLLDSVGNGVLKKMQVTMIK